MPTPTHPPTLARPGGFVTAAVPLFGAALLLSAAPETVNQVPIDLPEYQVTAERELPPPEQWFYARLEVLSSASEGATKQLLTDFQRFAHAVDLVWPGARPERRVPAALIICGRDRKFEQFLPDALRAGERATTSFHRRDRERAVLVLDQQTKILNSIDLEGDASASVANPGFAVDAYRQLYREYVRFLLTEADAPPPAWLTEGLAQIFTNIRITETSIEVGRIENPNAVSPEKETAALINRGVPGGAPVNSFVTRPEDADFNVVLKSRALLPMEELFAITADSSEAQNPLNSTWAKQCYAFVHWGLYGDYGRHQQEFLTFVHRLNREPLNEALFKACFNLGYGQMLQALRGHIEFTRAKTNGVRAEKGQKIPEPPPVAVREAAEAEVGRLQGVAFALAGHPAEARAALILSYRRGERDPALLAELGLAELAAGEDTRARKLLEAAVARGAGRPRAHLELARLRLAEGLAAPKGAGGKLNGEQVARVLDPLFTARDQPPALPKIYELMAEAWAVSAFAPTAAHLAAVEQGVRLFPRDTTLVYRAAELRGKNGFSTEAHGLVRLGLRVAQDAPTRAKFEQLQASLPAPASEQPK
jgi:hypothetical protein